MDQPRNIRMLVAPFFLLGGLVLAAFLEPDEANWIRSWLSALKGDPTKGELLVAIFGAAAAVFALGYLIGVISVLVLIVLFLLISGLARRCDCSYYATYPAGTFQSFISDFKLPKPKNKTRFEKRRFTEFTAITFDHEILKERAEGLHEWLSRRWIAFHVSWNSAIALGLVITVVPLLDIAHDRHWVIPIVLVFFLLFWHALTCWFDVMRMIKFQAKRAWLKKDRDGPA